MNPNNAHNIVGYCFVGIVPFFLGLALSASISDRRASALLRLGSLYQLMAALQDDRPVRRGSRLAFVVGSTVGWFVRAAIDMSAGTEQIPLPSLSS